MRDWRYCNANLILNSLNPKSNIVPTEELSQKYFSRERVKNRMLRRAAEIWGFAESEMDDFDPLVTLLIEACAVEFEKIAGEIGKTQNRMLERLAELLYPGTISVKPAYGLIQVISSEPAAVLYPDALFLYKPVAGDRKREGQSPDLYFSPSHPTKIVDGFIRYIASSRELFSMEEGIQKNSMATASGKSIDHQHCLWLGLDLNEELASLEGISFFFNWFNEPESETWYQYLPYSHWSLQDAPLRHRAGFALPDEDADPGADLKKEFDVMKKIEEDIIELFNRHYISISSKETLDQLKVKRSVYPPVFERLFDKNTLRSLKDPLLWIEIRFPPVIPQHALDNVLCSMNAVPVLNRKLNKFSYKLAQSLNIVPLETEGSFLSVKEIVNSQGQSIKPVPLSSAETLTAETYTLRYGINRFDERNSYETLVNLTEIIREESSFFSSLGEDFLIQNIRELNQVLARLEDKIKMQRKKQSPYPYLIIRSGSEGAHITIEFWSCNGASANKIPIGSRLLPYRNSHVKTNSLFFIVPTQGGRDKFTDAEKIEQYKKLLLTHQRIVTREDLQAVVQTELGKAARRIEYNKVYVKSPAAGEGFIRCMQIMVAPEPGSFDEQEWQQRLRELQLKLEKQSVNNIPFQLKLANS